jgi:hypothetical protein
MPSFILAVPETSCDHDFVEVRTPHPTKLRSEAFPCWPLFSVCLTGFRPTLHKALVQHHLTDHVP